MLINSLFYYLQTKAIINKWAWQLSLEVFVFHKQNKNFAVRQSALEISNHDVLMNGVKGFFSFTMHTYDWSTSSADVGILERKVVNKAYNIHYILV